jgi:hypothetical protein
MVRIMYSVKRDGRVQWLWGKIFILIFLLFVFPLYDQVKMEEHPLKALIISRFFDFIRWPNGSEENGNLSRFVIGFIGNTPMADYKKKFTEKIRIPGKKLVFKDLTEPEQIVECHTVIIGENQSDRLKEILTLTDGKPILTIADTEGFGEKGVLINLYLSGKKVKFEINLPAVKRSGLIFSSKLYKLAKIID